MNDEKGRESMDIDKNQFLEYISNPGALTYHPEVEMLREIARKYPYFQSAHLLLTLAYHQSNSIFFDQALKKTALYAGDREVLYRLVNQSFQTQPDAPVTNQKEAQNDELAELDAMINQSSQALSTEQLLKEISEKSPSPANKEGEAEANPQEDTANQTSKGLSFLEWLNNVGAGSSAKARKSKEKSKASRQEGTAATKQEQKLNERQSRSELQKQPDKKAIVNAFLENRPKLKRSKTSFYDPDEMANRSVQEDEELVSEPLAQIYFQQGHYKKAIELYEKLSLLYPDKFHYFAEQIESVKKHRKK